MFCSEQRVDYKGNSAVHQASVASVQELYTPGKVEETLVESIVLDTGCSRTLIRSIGIARGGHGKAFALRSLNFALPSLNFALPSKSSSHLNCI